MNRPNNPDDWRFMPIRTFQEIAVIMQSKGETGMTRQVAQWYHDAAIKKLRVLLEPEGVDWRE